MENKKSKTQILPIVLLSWYFLAFLIIDTDIYSRHYNGCIAFADTVLYIASVLFFVAGGHSNWSKLSKYSLLTATILNILTELTYKFKGDDVYYYYTYAAILSIFLIVSAYHWYLSSKN